MAILLVFICTMQFAYRLTADAAYYFNTFIAETMQNNLFDELLRYGDSATY